MTQNDRFSLEYQSLFLCSLAVISLRIPWVHESRPLVLIEKEEIESASFCSFLKREATKRALLANSFRDALVFFSRD